jgi:hypothetical protein
MYMSINNVKYRKKCNKNVKLKQARFVRPYALRTPILYVYENRQLTTDHNGQQWAGEASIKKAQY